jgi:hypothetical protein
MKILAGLQRFEGMAVNISAGSPEESWQKLSFVLHSLTVSCQRAIALPPRAKQLSFTVASTALILT